MGLQDVQASQLQVYNSGVQGVVTQVITNSYNQGLSDQAAADGTQTSPADAAVIAQLQAQVAQLQAQDASDIAAGQSALAALQSQLDAVNASLADMTNKFNSDEAVIQGLKGAISQMQDADQKLQAAVAALQSLSQPVPAPASLK